MVYYLIWVCHNPLAIRSCVTGGRRDRDDDGGKNRDGWAQSSSMLAPSAAQRKEMAKTKLGFPFLYSPKELKSLHRFAPLVEFQISLSPFATSYRVVTILPLAILLIWLRLAHSLIEKFKTSTKWKLNLKKEKKKKRKKNCFCATAAAAKAKSRPGRALYRFSWRNDTRSGSASTFIHVFFFLKEKTEFGWIFFPFLNVGDSFWFCGCLVLPELPQLIKFIWEKKT